MTTGFFKRFQKIVYILLALFFLFIGGYAWTIKRRETVSLSRTFYFLVSKNTHIQAGVYQSVLDGGAGFVLEKEGEYFVALTVYQTQTQAETVWKNLSEETEIVEFSVDKLYFKGARDKKSKKGIISAFSCLGSYIQLLEKEIVRLNSGATQNSSKRVLQTLNRQIEFLEREYRGRFAPFESLCYRAKNLIKGALGEIVYVSDLRYLLCDMCFSFVKMSEFFSI